jgi:WD40 repeat protein
MRTQIADALSYFNPGVITTGPGASEAAIAAAEERLGVRFPPSMRAFLAEINGLTLPNSAITHVPEPGEDGDILVETDNARAKLRYEKCLGVGSSATGDYFVMLTEETDERGEHPIVMIDHEDNHLMAVVASTYERFVWFGVDDERRERKPTGECKDKEIYGPWPFKKKWVLEQDPNLKPWLSAAAQARINKLLKPPRREVQSISVSPVTGELAAVYWHRDGEQVLDTYIRIFDLGTGEKLRLLRMDGERVAKLRYSPDGTMLATQSYRTDGETGVEIIKIFDPLSGEEVRRAELPISGCHICFAAECEELAILVPARPGEIWIWNVRSGEVTEKNVIEGTAVFPHQPLAATPRGDWFALAMKNGAVLFDMRSKTQRYLEVTGGGVDLLAFSPDGSRLAGCHGRCSLTLWDTATGEPYARGDETIYFRANGGLVFSPDGTLLAAGGYSHDKRFVHEVRIYDPATGEILRVLTGNKDHIEGIGFAPDGSVLVSGGLDGTVRKWNPHNGESLGNL